jgi:Transposase DDE domain group 1
LRVQATKPPARFEITWDGDGIAGHAGAALLGELADRLGLTAALGWRAAHTQTSRHRHPAGAVLRDLTVLLAAGGDCLSDPAVLRDQPELFGPVASTATAWRVIEQVAADELGLAGIRAARAQARGRAWTAGGHPEVDLLVVDVDGTLLDAHSDKQGAAGTDKGGYGFYPLVAFLDRGDGTGEALAGILRAGTAGSNTAADHIQVTDLALAQLPSAARAQPIVVRADTGGATHAFTDHLRQQGVGFSISLPADDRVRAAVLAVPAAAWRPAVDPTASRGLAPRSPSLPPWTLPAGRWTPGRSAGVRTPTRRAAQLHRRRRPPLPGVAHRPARPDIARLELRHRQRARVEDRIRVAKATGLRNLPFGPWRRNAVWLELVLMAQDLTCWAQALLLDGDLKVAEPKTLRYRLWHVAARVVHHPRRVIVRLQRSWPWATTLAAAFTRLRALPLRCQPLPAARGPWSEARPGWHARGIAIATWQPPAAPTTTPSEPTSRWWAASASQPTPRSALDRRHQRLMKSRG